MSSWNQNHVNQKSNLWIAEIRQLNSHILTVTFACVCLGHRPNLPYSKLVLVQICSCAPFENIQIYIGTTDIGLCRKVLYKVGEQLRVKYRGSREVEWSNHFDSVIFLELSRPWKVLGNNHMYFLNLYTRLKLHPDLSSQGFQYFFKDFQQIQRLRLIRLSNIHGVRTTLPEADLQSLDRRQPNPIEDSSITDLWKLTEPMPDGMGIDVNSSVRIPRNYQTRSALYWKP